MIVTSGCSFTKYKWECWPKYISWFDNAGEVLNLGNSGSGNETISRLANNAVLKYKSKLKKIYIMWSGSDRYEVIDEHQHPKIQAEKTYSRYDPDFNWSVWIGGHKDKKCHDFYQKNFLNEKHNWFKTLERILYTQMFLEKHKINYVMMIMNQYVINHNSFSNAESAVYNQIDWTKFKFYKDKLGLEEFAKELYPEHFLNNGDAHPCPYTHYQWTRQIIFQSDLKCPAEEETKLINRTNELNESRS